MSNIDFVPGRRTQTLHCIVAGTKQYRPQDVEDDMDPQIRGVDGLARSLPYDPNIDTAFRLGRRPYRENQVDQKHQAGRGGCCEDAAPPACETPPLLLVFLDRVFELDFGETGARSSHKSFGLAIFILHFSSRNTAERGGSSFEESDRPMYISLNMPPTYASRSAHLPDVFFWFF
jgi:hypothetical protein